MKTEKVTLFKVSKQNGTVIIDKTRDASDYEIYGILKVFVKNLGEELQDLLTPDDKYEGYDDDG